MTDKYLAGGFTAGLCCGFGAAARWCLAGGSSVQEPAGGGADDRLDGRRIFWKICPYALPAGWAGRRGHKKLPNVGYS